MKEIFFFSVGIFSARYFLGRIFFALKSLCRTFFSEVTLTVIPPPPPLKSQMVRHLLGLRQAFLPHVGED